MGISNQFIFYNRNIKIGQKLLYNKNLFEAGLWRIKDLFNRDNNIIPFRELQRRGVLEKNYMIWRGIVNIVLNKWKHNITHEDPDVRFTICILHNGKKVDLLDQDTKTLNRILVAEKYVKPKALRKYENYFGINISDETMSNIFTLANRISYDNKLKEMQYKILHQYIPTNQLLYKMKKIDSVKCNFCSLYCEDIYHLFYACLAVKDIWFFVERICKDGLNVTHKLTCSDILLGFMTEKLSTVNIIINRLILYGKYYILQCKYNLLKRTYYNIL